MALSVGLLLYNRTVGGMAAVFYIASIAILAGNHDVRTDALLTGFVTLAIWQLVAFVQSEKITHSLLAGAFLAGGVATKGAIAALIPGCVLLFLVLDYLNVLFPLFAIFTAGYLYRLDQSGLVPWLRRLTRIQGVILAALSAAFLVLNVWVFPVREPLIIGAFMAGLAFLALVLRRSKLSSLERVWVPSAMAILMGNILLNIHFYPQLDRYQAGSTLARKIQEAGIDSHSVYLYQRVYPLFDSYTRQWTPMLTEQRIAELLQKDASVLLIANEEGRNKLKQRFACEEVLRTADYPITLVSAGFLNPKTRSSTYGFLYLLRVNRSL